MFNRLYCSNSIKSVRGPDCWQTPLYKAQHKIKVQQDPKHDRWGDMNQAGHLGNWRSTVCATKVKWWSQRQSTQSEKSQTLLSVVVSPAFIASLSDTALKTTSTLKQSY